MDFHALTRIDFPVKIFCLKFNFQLKFCSPNKSVTIKIMENLLQVQHTTDISHSADP